MLALERATGALLISASLRLAASFLLSFFTQSERSISYPCDPQLPSPPKYTGMERKALLVGDCFHTVKIRQNEHSEMNVTTNLTFFTPTPPEVLGKDPWSKRSRTSGTVTQLPFGVPLAPKSVARI